MPKTCLCKFDKKLALANHKKMKNLNQFQIQKAIASISKSLIQKVNSV